MTTLNLSETSINWINCFQLWPKHYCFPIDPNARENFLELASRRESILRLARLLSYNPKRNIPANGLLKMESITTSEDVIDSNGTNLNGQTIIWNDPSNPNWREQFERVLNVTNY